MSEILPIRATFVPGPPDGTVPDADLERINATTVKPFSKDDLAVFACVMATQDLTTYATRLGTSSLVNFAADAKAGIPYLLDHNPDGGIYGYTYDGQYAPDNNEARSAVYIPKARRPGGYGAKTSDQEISDIQSGMRRALSVGFGGPLIEWRCDLCGNDVFSMDCPHLPGMKFDGTLATATVENARLLELSGVYNGACPGAVIGKAQEMYAASQFGAKQFRGWLDTLHVPDPTRFTSVPHRPITPDTGKENKPMREKLAAALSRLGLTTMAAAILGAEDDNADNMASRMAAQVQTEVDAKVSNHPLLQALSAAKITTPEQVSKMAADQARLAAAFPDRRAETQKNINIAYPAASQEADRQEQMEMCAALPDGPAFDKFAARMKAEAEKSAARGAGGRQTAATENTGVGRYASDAVGAEAEAQSEADKAEEDELRAKVRKTMPA